MFDLIVQKIDSFLWDYPLLFLLLGTGVVLTIVSKGIQKYTFKGIRLSLQKETYLLMTLM